MKKGDLIIWLKDGELNPLCPAIIIDPPKDPRLSDPILSMLCLCTDGVVHRVLGYLEDFNVIAKGCER